MKNLADKYITDHFTKDEMRCRCGCGYLEWDDAFMFKLEEVRQIFDRRMDVSSGSRCPAHNAAIGGVPDSEHIDGAAVDIPITHSQDRYDLIAAALKAGITRIGVSDKFIHLGGGANKPQHVLWTY